MQPMKCYPLALTMASLMISSGLAAAQWSTVVARASATDGYEVRANQFRIAQVPIDYFAGLQAGEGQLRLPLPEGGEVIFSVQPYALLPADLAGKYPDIQTFKGVNPTAPTETGRFDLGPQGFHAMFSHQGKTVFVDPLRNAEGYAIYYQQDAYSRLEDEADQVIGDGEARLLASKVQVEGNERRRYVIAVSASGEYTQYHGGTVASGLAAIATLLNRVNEVYQRDLGAEFQLASGNDSIIYTDAATDPFFNGNDPAGSGRTDTDVNVEVQTAALGRGLGKFDIGHVLNTGGGGLAGLGVLCGAERSAGMSGAPGPDGDAFFIDFVAHELGHQFGSLHTFNGTTGSCGGGNRTASQAWEPGSGSSIMAYAGICGDENLQANSEPYFHSKSIEQMRAVMASVPACGTLLSLSNNAPQVDAGGDHVIPANTPFVLSGMGADLDQDPLLYNWEQIDLGNESYSAASMIDDGRRPLFRFVAPTGSPERTLPSFSSLFANHLDKGEAWPATNRDLNFRLTVRDGKGGVASDDMKVQVVNTGRAFRLTSPVGTSLRAGSQTVEWDVAGTNLPPINCGKVDLLLTWDDGATWLTLASAQPNSGSASVMIPAGGSGIARLKVACSDNIFFAVAMPNPLGMPITQAISGIGGETGSGRSGNGGGGSLGLWTLVLVLLGWQRRRA